MSLMTVKAYISQFGFFKSNYIVPAETHFRTHGLQERWWGYVQRKEGYHRYITPERLSVNKTVTKGKDTSPGRYNCCKRTYS